MSDFALSLTGAYIRLTVERWDHIVDQHDEFGDLRPDVLETVRHPDMVVAGGAGELLAVRERQPDKWLVVAYRG